MPSGTKPLPEPVLSFVNRGPEVELKIIHRKVLKILESSHSNFCMNCLNPLRAKFFRGNIYLHFMSLLHIDMTQVLKILPRVRPGHILHSQHHGCWCPGCWCPRTLRVNVFFRCCPWQQRPWTWTTHVGAPTRHWLRVLAMPLWQRGWIKWRWVVAETFYMKCEGCIRHHGNLRWRQIQIRIQVCNAERPLMCGAAANVQTFTYGRCYDITRSRVNNVIKNLPTHQFVLALLFSWFLLYLRHSLNGNINFKIGLFLECAIHGIWQLGPEVFKDLFVFSNLFYYPAALKGSGVLSSPERAGGRADKPR